MQGSYYNQPTLVAAYSWLRHIIKLGLQSLPIITIVKLWNLMSTSWNFQKSKTSACFDVSTVYSRKCFSTVFPWKFHRIDRLSLTISDYWHFKTWDEKFPESSGRRLFGNEKFGGKLETLLKISKKFEIGTHVSNLRLLADIQASEDLLP